MKSLLIVLVCIVLMTFLFAGCLPEWLTPGQSDPEVPELKLEANVDALLITGEPDKVAWSIENIGGLFIREYIITFDVFYPMTGKDNVIFTVVGNYLEVGEKKESMIELVKYDTPETVSVEWELFE